MLSVTNAATFGQFVEVRAGWSDVLILSTITNRMLCAS